MIYAIVLSEKNLAILLDNPIIRKIEKGVWKIIRRNDFDREGCVEYVGQGQHTGGSRERMQALNTSVTGGKGEVSSQAKDKRKYYIIKEYEIRYVYV